MKKEQQAFERIISAVKERVLNWEYPPDHPLGEEALSREFGVSRSPVREALRMLEASGIVRRIPNRGYFVRQVRSHEVAELYDVRFALEVYALEHLVLHPECIDAVREKGRLWSEIPETGQKPDARELAQIDERFHEGLVSILGNSMLDMNLRRINDRLFVFRLMDFDRVLESDALEQTRRDHLSIVSLIADRDLDAAKKALKENIMHGRSNVDQTIGLALMKAYASSPGLS